MKRRFSDEQIIGMIKEYEAGVKAQELCRKYGISDATFDLRPDFPPAIGRIRRLTSGLMRPWFPVLISVQIPRALDCPGMSGVCSGCNPPSTR